ncbi:MAG: DNA polymerase III subunit delta [Oscillospiraceae bacterium]|nr:DNA polymerase III subunit delta [Oscillospiraceae bacterium]
MPKPPPSCDFNAELKKLKTAPPARIYLLYGNEDYLSDFFLTKLRDCCLPGGDDGFSYKRFDGPALDLSLLAKALDVMPFLSERTFIELRNVDINKLPDTDKAISLLQSVPDYCTVVFFQDASYEPDGRLKFVKFLKEKGTALLFSAQGRTALFRWMDKRFAASGKTIEPAAKERLVLISGDLMNRLIPEIDKIAAYAKGSVVHVSDVEAVASHIPEADVFEMINLISEKKYDNALHILAELLKNKENEPIGMLSLVASQLRKTYGVKLALHAGKRKPEIIKLFSITWDFIADRLISAAGRFTFPQLRAAIESCVNAEYSMKTSSVDESGLLTQVLLDLMLDDAEDAS